MYRPTVRYDDIFRSYVDDLFQATYLDRNQIIRLALFSAALSAEFCSILEKHKKKDVSLPSPKWELKDERYWMEQNPKTKGGGKDVNAKHGGKNKSSEDVSRDSRERPREHPENRCIEPVTRREGAVPSGRITIKERGGISFTFN